MSTRHKLVLLGALYLAQGLPFGFFTQALPVMLRELGVSLEHIGLTGLLAMPWGLKFLWAPLVERGAPRRRWILALQATAVALALGLALLEPGRGLWVLVVAVLLTNLVAATQDIATDGLAVSLLAPGERGLGNGVQVAGYRVGMILGGGALLVAFDAVGWTTTLGAMAALLALCAVPLLGAPSIGAAPLVGARAGNPWSWVTLPGALRWTAVMVAFKLGDYLAGGMLRPWLVDLGLDMAEIGTLVGVGGFVAGLVGAAVGGALVQRMGRVRALVVFGLLQSSGVFAYAVAALGSPDLPTLWAVVVWEHLVGGFATVALFTAMMDASRVEEAGTDYTVQASLVVGGSGLGTTLSGYVAASTGYAGVFFAGAVLSLLGPALAAIPSMTELTRTASGASVERA